MSGTILHSMTHRLAICALAGLFVATVAPQAFSGAPDDSIRSFKVTYADLDLSKAAGAAVLYKRIRNAARIVCDFYGDSIDKLLTRGYDKCISTAVAAAVDKVNNPMLTAKHREKTKGAGLS